MRPHLLAVVCLLIGAPAFAAQNAQADGTRRMAERLKQITARTNPELNPFMSSRRAQLLGSMVTSQGAKAPPALLREYAQELLYAGRTAEAIARYDQLRKMMQASGLDPRSPPWVDLMMRQAVANLRRGEDENCVFHHNARSCMFPIRGSGVHKEQRGSREASRILGQLLAQEPGNLGARWLLNIAFMTLGEYPGGLPRGQLLAPELFESEYAIKPFPDIASELSVAVDDLAGGSILEDFDGDGSLDIMASAMGFESQLRYFHNEADGTFSDRTAAAGLTGEVGGLNIVQTDYNNDGHADVFVLRGGWMGPGGHFPDSLLRNNGDGTFTDVTEPSHLLSLHPDQTGAWLDFDSDGWLDLFVGNESAEGETHPCELFRNNGDGTFSECAGEAGVATAAYVKGVTSGDFNNDGRPDLYLSVHGGPNHLFRNDGATGGAKKPGSCGWRFTDVTAAAGVTEPHHSFPRGSGITTTTVGRTCSCPGSSWESWATSRPTIWASRTGRSCRASTATTGTGPSAM